LSDLWRIPKASYWFVKAQWTEDPFVHIVGHWTWPGQEDQPKMIRIYSTCDEVELFLNGKSLGKRQPEPIGRLIAEWKSYGYYEPWPKLPDGTHLRHGPFVWRIPYQPGILRAVGVKDGRQYADERRTAGAPARIILKADRETMKADGRDAVRIVATVADQEGVTVPSAMNWLSFQVEGPGRLLGTPVLDAVWGMAAINVMSDSAGGTITLRASSRGLQEGVCTLAAESRH
jgi:beta-galactosidase